MPNMQGRFIIYIEKERVIKGNYSLKGCNIHIFVFLDCSSTKKNATIIFCIQLTSFAYVIGEEH